MVEVVGAAGLGIAGEEVGRLLGESRHDLVGYRPGFGGQRHGLLGWLLLAEELGQLGTTLLDRFLYPLALGDALEGAIDTTRDVQRPLALIELPLLRLDQRL